MITKLGEYTLAGFNPAMLSALASANATIAADLPNLVAQLDGAVLAAAGLVLTPPTLAGQILALAELTAAVIAAISLGVPGVTFQLDAVLALIAQLTATIGALEAQLTILISLGDLLAVGGVSLYVYEGRTDQFGAELHAALGSGFAAGGPATGATALVLATSQAGAWTAMQTLFGI